MGDDNEIRQLIKLDSENFLRSALDKSKSLVTQYDFDAEFAKTKKNRSFVVVGSTLATVLALGVAAFLLTSSIQRQAAEAPVDVRAFDDLNLKDLLDSSKRDAADLERVKQDIARLDYDYKSGLESADRAYQAAVESVKTAALPQADEEAGIAAAARDRDAARKRAQDLYASGMVSKHAEEAAIQKRVDRYDSRLTAQAKQQEAVLASQRTAFDLERQKQTQQYEAQIAELKAARSSDLRQSKQEKEQLSASLTARYNPRLADPRSAALLGTATQAPVPIPDGFHPYLAAAGIIGPASESGLDQAAADFLYLSSKLRAVPYLNSVPSALAKMEGELRSSAAAYKLALSSAGGALQARDQTIAARDAAIASLTARAQAAEASLERYRFAVAAFAGNSRESGFVVDARDPARILVYIVPALEVAEGSIGYASRNDKAVATLALHPGPGGATASLLRLEPGESLRPFDSLAVGGTRGQAADGQ